MRVEVKVRIHLNKKGCKADISETMNLESNGRAIFQVQVGLVISLCPACAYERYKTVNDNFPSISIFFGKFLPCVLLLWQVMKLHSITKF